MVRRRAGVYFRVADIILSLIFMCYDKLALFRGCVNSYLRDAGELLASDSVGERLSPPFFEYRKVVASEMVTNPYYVGLRASHLGI